MARMWLLFLVLPLDESVYASRFANLNVHRKRGFQPSFRQTISRAFSIPSTTILSYRIQTPAFLSPINNHHYHKPLLSQERLTRRTKSPRIADKINSNEEESNLQSVYKQVQQDDSDWYNSLSKLLGDADANFSECDNGDAGDGIANEGSIDEMQSDGKMSEKMSDAVDKPSTQLNDEAETTKRKTGSKIQQIPMEKTLEEKPSTPDDSIYSGDNASSRTLYDAIDIQTQEQQTKTIQSSDSASIQERAMQSAKSVVRLRNKFTKQCESIASLSTFIKMGYAQNDVTKLRPRVLDLILEDSIPKPRRGIPDQWVRDTYEDWDDEDADWVVEVVGGDTSKQEKDGIDKQSDVGATIMGDTSDKSMLVAEPEVAKQSMPKLSGETVSESWGPFSSSRVAVDQQQEIGTAKVRNAVQNQSAAKKDQDAARQRDTYTESNPPDRPKRRQPMMDDYSEAAPGRRDRRMYQRPNRPRRTPAQDTGQPRSRPRRRELVIDRDYDDNDNNPPSNKFWMDLPTFKEFLRTEAKLRLTILGPDWKESVLDESRWRFDLYKRWLFLLNDGVGENPLYTYGDRPSQPQRRRASRRDMVYGSPSRRERSSDQRPRRSGRNERQRNPYNEPEDDELFRARRRSDSDREEDFTGQREERQRPSDEYEARKSRRYGETSDGEDDEPPVNDENQCRSNRREDTDSKEVNPKRRLTKEDAEEESELYREYVEYERAMRRSEPREDDVSIDRDTQPRSRRRTYDQPASSRRKQVEWKSFGDLEESLMNGRRDDDDIDYVEERVAAPRRRTRG
jgi:hypothetical protein